MRQTLSERPAHKRGVSFGSRHGSIQRSDSRLTMVIFVGRWVGSRGKVMGEGELVFSAAGEGRRAPGRSGGADLAFTPHSPNLSSFPLDRPLCSLTCTIRTTGLAQMEEQSLLDALKVSGPCASQAGTRPMSSPPT